MKHTVIGREAELVNRHAGDGALARAMDAEPDSPPSRLPARVLIWDDEPEAQAASKAEFVGPPRPGLMLAAAFFDVRVIDYSVQVLNWD